MYYVFVSQENNRSLNDSVKGMISAVEQFEENEKKMEEIIKTKVTHSSLKYLHS